VTLADLIKKRRSTRRFSDRAVEKDKIMMCLEAARLAPSACNSQPWKFIVVDDAQLKDRLSQAAFGGVYSISSFARKAPVMVAIVSEKDRFIARVGALLRGTRYYLIDIGIAGEHFVLQAEELGLGSCWIGWFNEKGAKSVLNVPKDKKIDVLLAVGYPDKKSQGSRHNREPMAKIASFNSY
jgi:nitroreductase